MTQQYFRLLDLPTELRLYIYEYLPFPAEKRMPIDHSGPIKAWDNWLLKGRAPAWYWYKSTCDMAILRTCRKIHTEARTVITRALAGPPSSPSLHFSSHGFSVFEIMFKLEGDPMCCEKHPIRKVREMIMQRRRGLATVRKAMRLTGTRIDYFTRDPIGRALDEVLDLAEDMAALHILDTRPGSRLRPREIWGFSLTKTMRPGRYTIDREVHVREKIKHNHFGFITGEWPGSFMTL